MRKFIFSLVLGAALAISQAPRAHAAGRDFVIYAPGMGSSSEQAKPYLEAFFKYVEKRLAWPHLAGNGEYFEDAKALAGYIEKQKPGFALVPPGYYLELACKKTSISPLVVTVRTGDVGKTARFHVVVKKGGAKNLEELKGKKLISNHFEDMRFVTRLVFEEKFDVEKSFKVESTASPIKPFKSVDRGEADAALVDDAQLAHMKTLPFGASLEVIYSSPALPPFSIISFDKVTSAADRDGLKRALVEMCGSKDGAETCKSMTMSRFEAADPKVFDGAEARYCKP